mgnify:CR=1 FL=1
MGGKSTYMRQIALSVIMAQIGSFVPADKANMPIFDQIFTRIGASDDLISGQSTFMVEMLEANNALRYATKDSLIILMKLVVGQQLLMVWPLPNPLLNTLQHLYNV